MLNKIYFGLLAVAVLVMSFFTYYTNSWLHSIGSPENAATNSSFYSGLGLNFLWVSFLVLIVVANIIIWKKGKSILLWLSFVFFAIFMTLQTFWLSPTLQSFKQTNGLSDSSFSVTPIIGAITIIVLAIAVFFNQFIVFRLLQKVTGHNESAEIEVNEEV